MKKKICSLGIILIMWSNIANSQSGWIQQESGTTNVLYSVYFVNVNTGWICGNNGIILKTTNSGNNWITQTSNTDVYLVTIYFLNGNSGFASGFKSNPYPTIGYKSVIMKTTDGGIIWDTLDTSTEYYMSSINFINSNTGFFAGGLYGLGPNKILKTTDGGNTLEEQISSVSGNLFSIKFVNSNSGFICGMYGNIVKTINGGAEWFEQSVLPLHILNSITFLDENTGYVVGGNLSWPGYTPSSYIGKTTNGGLNWITQLDTTGHFLSQINFVNQYTGYVCGSPDFSDLSGCWHNKFYKTTNSGNEWIELSTPILESFTSIYFNDANTGFAVGCGGKILKTTNGGITSIYSFSNEVPSQYILEQNYPNPFNPSTNINFSIPVSSFVTLKVFNIMGKEIEILVNENLNPGVYNFDFDAKDLASGIYFYKLTAGSSREAVEFLEVKKMTLLK